MHGMMMDDVEVWFREYEYKKVGCSIVVYVQMEDGWWKKERVLNAEG